MSGCFRFGSMALATSSEGGRVRRRHRTTRSTTSNRCCPRSVHCGRAAEPGAGTAAGGIDPAARLPVPLFDARIALEVARLKGVERERAQARCCHPQGLASAFRTAASRGRASCRAGRRPGSRLLNPPLSAALRAGPVPGERIRPTTRQAAVGSAENRRVPDQLLMPSGGRACSVRPRESRVSLTQVERRSPRPSSSRTPRRFDAAVPHIMMQAMGSRTRQRGPRVGEQPDLRSLRSTLGRPLRAGRLSVAHGHAPRESREVIVGMWGSKTGAPDAGRAAT